MKRSDFPKPFTTCLIDLNSEAAFAERGETARKYPRVLPVPFTSISADPHKLLLEPWRKNMKFYPQIFFLVAKDVAPRAGVSFDDAVLGIGLGLASSDDGIVAASANPTARDQLMCYWYSLYSDNAQVLADEMTAGVNARELQITIESPTLGKQVFDQKDLLFDPVETLTEMNDLIAYRKYDLFSLGSAGAPITVAADQKFQPNEVITISCPQLGKLEIVVDDQRDPGTVIPSWKPRAFFMEPEYL